MDNDYAIGNKWHQFWIYIYYNHYTDRYGWKLIHSYRNSNCNILYIFRCSFLGHRSFLGPYPVIDPTTAASFSTATYTTTSYSTATSTPSQPPSDPVYHSGVRDVLGCERERLLAYLSGGCHRKWQPNEWGCRDLCNGIL
jgi:hypothetical protein